MFSQENAYSSFDISLKNSIKFNKHLINPAFSFAKENAPTLTIVNRRQWVDFENAPQFYFANYLGRLSNRSRFGLGIYQQSAGLLKNFGGVLNYSYSVPMGYDSNLTFGLNTYFYNSTFDFGKIITVEDEPLLLSQKANTLIGLKPGINFGTEFFDFGVSVNNLVLYNLATSEMVKDNQQNSFLGHIMYTGYIDSYRDFFDDAKFSTLFFVEKNKDATAIAGTVLLDIPNKGWAQGGYNTLLGFSAGVGITISEKFSIGYNYDLGLGDISELGASHQILLAYTFDEYEEITKTYRTVKQKPSKSSKKTTTAVVKTKDELADEKANKIADTKLKREIDWKSIKERRVDIPEISIDKREKNFNEVSLGYTKEQALFEANRCRQCECKLCMKECMMLKEYTSCPKSIFREYLEKGYENIDKMIAFSCNECSQCTIKCPKDFDLKSNFIEMKKQYIKDNGNKQVIESLIPSDRIQAMECSPKYSISVQEKKSPKYVFVPGCTIPAYKPELVEKVYAHLKEVFKDDVSTMLQCCGKVTNMIGEEDKFKIRNKLANDEIEKIGAEVIITICPSCYKTYSETSNKKVISYWDLMKNEIGLPKEAIGKGNGSPVVFNIHDSCATREVVSHHENIRWILKEMGYKYEEMHNVGKNTRCCGVGGMVCSSNPELYKKLYIRRGNDCTQDSVISYCGSCRGTLEAAGKDSLHILDLIFGDKYETSTFEKRSYKDEEEMWKNRLKTKELLKNLK